MQSAIQFIKGSRERWNEEKKWSNDTSRYATAQGRNMRVKWKKYSKSSRLTHLRARGRTQIACVVGRDEEKNLGRNQSKSLFLLMLSAHDKNTTNEYFFCASRLSICSISSICREFRSQLTSLWRLESVLKDLSTFFGDRKNLNEHLPFIRFSE